MKWICIESEKDLPKRYYEEKIFVELKSGERTAIYYECEPSKSRWLNIVSKWLDESPTPIKLDWKEKVTDLFYHTPGIGYETIKIEYENPEALKRWIQSNVLLEGIDLVEGYKVEEGDLESSSNALGNDIGDAVR